MFESSESVQVGGGGALLDPAWTGLECLEAMREHKRVLARAQYRQVEAVTAFYDRCCAEDQPRGINQAHSGESAPAELSIVLAMNEGTVRWWIDLGLELRARLHRTRAAFA